MLRRSSARLRVGSNRQTADAIEAISAGIAGLRAIGATIWGTSWLAHLALAYAEAWMNSMMLGVASAKQRQRSKQPKNDGIRPRSIASPVKSHLSRMIRTFGKRKRISTVHCMSRAVRRQNPGSCALR